MKKKFLMILIIVFLPVLLNAGNIRFIVTPLGGMLNNKLNINLIKLSYIPMSQQYVPTGVEKKTLSDNGPEFGVMFLVIGKNFTITEFPFYARANESDIFGNMLYINGFYPLTSIISVNAGMGLIWHEIRMDMKNSINNGRQISKGSVNILVPIPKLGLKFKLPIKGCSINPYLGYMSERVGTDIDTEVLTSANKIVSKIDIETKYRSVLYGTNLYFDYHHFLQLVVKFYYQDMLEDEDDDIITARARASMMFNKQWGIAARIEYMEHTVDKTLSFLIGPVYSF